MAKKRKSSKKGTSRRRRVGAMGGKLTNRSITVQLTDLLYLAGGAVLNYAVVNPLLNRLTSSLKKADGTPMLGEHQAKIITALKGGGAAWAAYATKLPKEAKLALFGVAGASGVELAGQIMPDKMVAIQGTGDLFMGSVGNVQYLNVPMKRKGIGNTELYNDVVLAGGLTDNEVVTAGMGDLFDTNDDFPY